MDIQLLSGQQIAPWIDALADLRIRGAHDIIGDRAFGESNRLWVTNSPLYAPSWSSEVRDASARRLTHRAVCVA